MISSRTLFLKTYDASLDIRDMFAGKHVPVYKVDEDGTMREISFAEQEVDKAIRQVSANDTVTLFTLMFYAIWYICRQLQHTLEHHPYENNVVFLRQIRRYISEISAMRLSEQLVEEVRILAQDDFNKKYKDLQEQEARQRPAFAAVSVVLRPGGRPDLQGVSGHPERGRRLRPLF